MIDDYPRALTLVAALGAGVAGGVFFAFSTFIMKALRDLPPPEGIAAMQSINKQAPTPWFMSLLFGTAILSVVVAVLAIVRWGDPPSPYQLAGGASYLAGMVITIAYHVPRNDALAEIDPSGDRAAATWSRYLGEWVPWNHVRVLTSVVAAVLFTLALRAD